MEIDALKDRRFTTTRLRHANQCHPNHVPPFTHQSFVPLSATEGLDCERLATLELQTPICIDVVSFPSELMLERVRLSVDSKRNKSTRATRFRGWKQEGIGIFCCVGINHFFGTIRGEIEHSLMRIIYTFLLLLMLLFYLHSFLRFAPSFSSI